MSVVAILALSGLTLVNSLPYFSFRDNFAFLVEKGERAFDVLWRASFYAHVAGGMACLAVGPFLFWTRLLRASPGLHRTLGRVYAVAVLGCAGPAGIHLAFHAKGGAAGTVGFLLLGLLWWGETAQGVRDIVARRIPEHRRWMKRSYAMALSAVFFRVIQLALLPLDLSYDTAYVAALWLSLAASLAAGEWMVRRPLEGREPVMMGAGP
jgi:hypothetical protein